MSTPTNDNEFLYELELEVRTELTQAGQPDQNTGGAPAAEGVLDPDAERYEVSLRTLLGAVEAMEDGSHLNDHPRRPR